MTGLTRALVGAVAVAGIAASLLIQQSGRTKLRAQAEAARRQAEQIAQLGVENESLSNLVARTGSPQVLPPDELRELLKLRGQIGLLREATRERARLETANQQLRAAQANLEQQLAAARAAPNFWSKDQLAFAGYAEPEAALKTVLWAMRNGDAKTYLAASAAGPELLAHLTDAPKEKVEAQMAAEGKILAEGLGPSIGFHIVEKQVKSSNEVIFNLSFDGEGKTRRFVMQRTGNEWKLAEMLRPGQNAP